MRGIQNANRPEHQFDKFYHYQYHPQNHFDSSPYSNAESSIPMQINAQQHPDVAWNTGMAAMHNGDMSLNSAFDDTLHLIAKVKSYIQNSSTAGMTPQELMTAAEAFKAVPNITTLISATPRGTRLVTRHSRIHVANWNHPDDFDIAHANGLDQNSRIDVLAATKLRAMIDKHFNIDHKLQKVIQIFAGIAAFESTFDTKDGSLPAKPSDAEWKAYWVEDHAIRVHIAELQNTTNGLLTILCKDFDRFAESVRGVLPQHPHLATWLLYLQDFCGKVYTILKGIIKDLVDIFHKSLQEDKAARIAIRMVTREQCPSQASWRADFVRCIRTHHQYLQPGPDDRNLTKVRNWNLHRLYIHEKVRFDGWKQSYKPLCWGILNVKCRFQDTKTGWLGLSSNPLDKSTMAKRVSYSLLNGEELERSQILRQVVRQKRSYSKDSSTIPMPQTSRKRKLNSTEAEDVPRKKPKLEQTPAIASSSTPPASSTSNTSISKTSKLVNDAISEVGEAQTDKRTKTVPSSSLAAKAVAHPFDPRRFKAEVGSSIPVSRHDEHVTPAGGLESHVELIGEQSVPSIIVRPFLRVLKRKRSYEDDEIPLPPFKVLKTDESLNGKQATKEAVASSEQPSNATTPNLTQEMGDEIIQSSSFSSSKQGNGSSTSAQKHAEVLWCNIPGLQSPKQGTPGTPDSGYDSIRSSLHAGVAGATLELHTIPQFHLDTADSDLRSSPSAPEPENASRPSAPPLSSAPPGAPEDEGEEL